MVKIISASKSEEKYINSHSWSEPIHVRVTNIIFNDFTCLSCGAKLRERFIRNEWDLGWEYKKLFCNEIIIKNVLK